MRFALEVAGKIITDKNIGYRRNTMKLKKTLLTGLTAVALCGAGVANAGVDFRFNWGATGQGFSGPATSDVVREMKFTAESVIVFDTAPFSGTFTDYIVLRIDQLFDSSGDAIATPYGTGSGMQITLAAVLHGTQTSALAYDIDSASRFDLYYDGPTGVFTNASFAGALANFTDGALVETASSVFGSGVNSPTAPDGALDLFAILLDAIGFEVTPGGVPLSLSGVVTAATNSNNHVCGTPTQTCGSTPGAILGFFGAPAPGAGLAFHTRSDGSIEKTVQAIPEPGTLGLLGLALVVMGLVTNRRKNHLG